MPSHVSWSLKDSGKPSGKLQEFIFQKQISPLGLWHLPPCLSLVCFGILQPPAHLLSMLRLCALQASSVTLFRLKLACEISPRIQPQPPPLCLRLFLHQGWLHRVVSAPGRVYAGSVVGPGSPLWSWGAQPVREWGSHLDMYLAGSD